MLPGPKHLPVERCPAAAHSAGSGRACNCTAAAHPRPQRCRPCQAGVWWWRRAGGCPGGTRWAWGWAQGWASCRDLQRECGRAASAAGWRTCAQPRSSPGLKQHRDRAQAGSQAGAAPPPSSCSMIEAPAGLSSEHHLRRSATRRAPTASRAACSRSFRACPAVRCLQSEPHAWLARRCGGAARAGAGPACSRVRRGRAPGCGHPCAPGGADRRALGGGLLVVRRAIRAARGSLCRGGAGQRVVVLALLRRHASHGSLRGPRQRCCCLLPATVIHHTRIRSRARTRARSHLPCCSRAS
jgi:hypothetical protein